MQVEMTDIQLIAAYAMTDAIGVLEPKAKIGLGAEIVREGKASADILQGNDQMLRQMILNYIAPHLAQIAKRQDEVVINIGYLMASGSLTVNVRAAGGVKYFNIDQNGHISEGSGESPDEGGSPAEGDGSWGGRW